MKRYFIDEQEITSYDEFVQAAVEAAATEARKIIEGMDSFGFDGKMFEVVNFELSEEDKEILESIFEWKDPADVAFRRDLDGNLFIHFDRKISLPFGGANTLKFLENDMMLDGVWMKRLMETETSKVFVDPYPCPQCGSSQHAVLIDHVPYLEDERVSLINEAAILNCQDCRHSYQIVHPKGEKI